MESRVDITVKGFEAVRHLVAQVPDRLPLAILKPVLIEVAQAGVEAMKMSIMRTTGEKSTGHLADSIDSVVDQLGEDSWIIRVGSPLEYARYPAINIAATAMNRPVQIRPPMRWAGFVREGKWRFIGIRPPMPKHPFLDDAANAMTKVLTDLFGDKLGIEVSEVEAETKALENIVERV